MKKLAVWVAVVVAVYFVLRNPITAADNAHTVLAGVMAFLDALAGGGR